MDVSKVLNHIQSQYSKLSNECQQEFISHFKINHLKKGDIVVREGQYSKKAFLILKGCARAYYVKEGKDISDWFGFENQFMAPVVSFFGDEPSPHYIEFLEEATVIELSKGIVDDLCQKYHDFERLISKVVTETMLIHGKRLFTIQFHKAEERYKHLLDMFPQIESRIPLTHIASYLGITLETLSRVRNPKYRI